MQAPLVSLKAIAVANTTNFLIHVTIYYRSLAGNRPAAQDETLILPSSSPAPPGEIC